MKYNSFEELEKASTEKRYSSVMAEYRRTARKSCSETIFRPIDELWSIITKSIFKDLGEENTYIGQKIYLDEGIAFLKDLKKNKIISIIFNKNGQFVTQTYEFKSLPNTFTKLTYIQEVKRCDTIAGFNGHLGIMMYRWQAKKRAIEIFKSLQPKEQKKK